MKGTSGIRALVDALHGLGVTTSVTDPGTDGNHDLVVEPGPTAVTVKRRSLVDQAAAAQLVAKFPSAPGELLVVLGDRVTAQGRALLLEHRAGYYDLRGHLALRTPHLVIDTDIEPLLERSRRRTALSGRAGLEVATALLLDPQADISVRELSRALGRAPSTVSDVLRALADENLVDDRRHVADAELFWQVAERWSTPRTYLARPPDPDPSSRTTGPLHLGLVDPEHSTGWARTESAAAAAYGAPVAVRSDQGLEAYVPDQLALRRAQRLLGTAPSASAACTVRVAPVPAVCERRVRPRGTGSLWPLAHPVFVALDLAQDVGRGREILDAWTPPAGWHRVW